MPSPFQPTFPFAPDKTPFFYGWVILSCCICTIIASSPGQTAGVGPFVDPLLIATQLDRTTLSTAYMFGTLASAFILPRAGKLVDLYGTRRVHIVACMLLASIIAAMSSIDHSISFWGRTLGINAATIALILLSGGFAVMRFAGQGLMVLCTQTAIGHWFNKRRGLATAISGSVLALVSNATPLFLDGFVQAFDWDGAWLILALIVGPCFGLLAWIFWREQPESCGLFPDGIEPSDEEKKNSSTLTGWTRGEAARTRAFWTVVGCFGMLGFVITATAFHLTDIGASVGLERTVSNSFLFVLGCTSMPIGFIGGLLADRIDPRVLIACVSGGVTLHLFTMPYYGPGLFYFIPACTLGFAAGMTGPMSIATIPKFFGRLHLGAINGLQWSVVVMASALAPVTYAAFKDHTDNYTTACWFLLPIAICLFLSACTLSIPQAKETEGAQT